MTKNKLHCLIIKESKRPKQTLSGIFDNWEGKVFAEGINDTSNHIIKKLLTGTISLLFTYSNNKQKLENYRNLLRRYSSDTILINFSIKNRPLLRDLSGIESCSINLADATNTRVIINNLLNYTQMKSDFRQCKHLLSVTDQRNRWLVNISHEPIAYIYKATHIHANAAYLSIFGFQSTAELKSTSIWDLVPEKSHKMFHNFIKKQQRNRDMRQTLLMTMNTADRNHIRTGVRIAPAVLNKTKCLQIWVHKIDEGLDLESTHANRASRNAYQNSSQGSSQNNNAPASPWENLPDKKINLSNDLATKSVATDGAIKNKPQQQPTEALNHGKNKSREPSKQLRKELNTVKLRLHPLTDTQSQAIEHYLASLEFTGTDKAQITAQLTQSNITETAIFWDRLIVSKLSKELANNQQSNNQYLIYLTTASFASDNFLNFLFKSLESLSAKHPHIVFLVPQSAYEKHHQRILNIKNALASRNCSLAAYDVVPKKSSLQKLLLLKPAYLAFSSDWIKQISANSEQYKKFIQLTEKLETMGQQVILS